MATRTRQGSSTRGKPARDKAATTPPAQRHATTPDATRQQQALDNQGSQGRMASPWHTRITDEDDEEDETPPTLH